MRGLVPLAIITAGLFAVGTLAFYGATHVQPASVRTIVQTSVQTTDALGSNGVPPGSCLIELPDGVKIIYTYGQNFTGAEVKYPNGVVALFPPGTCPQPVHQQQIEAALTAEKTPAFITATNGSKFVLYGAGPTGDAQINGTQRFLYDVDFIRFANYTGPCGGRLVLGEIYVTYLYESYQGPLDLQHPRVQTIPQSELNICEG
jgi:hypothetical protein